jgi:DNA-binding XRE family transcriptional regulator
MKPIRKKLNMNRTQFGALIGVSEQTVVRYETGKGSPSAPTARKIMDALLSFGVPAEEVQAELVKLWLGEK